MPAAGVVLLVAVVLIVLALVYYLVATIFALRQIVAGLDETIAAVGEIVEKTAPVDAGRRHHQRAPRRGRRRARGPARQEGRDGGRRRPRRRPVPGRRRGGVPQLPGEPRRWSRRGSREVYTKGTLTLARLGREAPIAAASPSGGPVLRNVTGGSLAARALYPEARQTRPERLSRSPVIGTDSPVQYEPSEEPGVRRRMPTTEGTPRADTGAV